MKIKLLAIALMLCTPFLFSSCKTCKSGGWYGKRNLDVSCVELPSTTDVCAIIE